MGWVSKLTTYLREFGYRQVPIWYESSEKIVDHFQVIGKSLKFIKIIPNPYPFYDWIMGFHERWSNRAALKGPILQGVNAILDVGVGTGYFLSRVILKTQGQQKITAVDLSKQMLINARTYIVRKRLLSDRIGFELANCKKLPHQAESFDLYISSYLFDLLNDKEIDETLIEMQRVLAPDGHAILITMTAELEDLTFVWRLFCRLANEFYCLGYHKGRWNPIWKFLFAGYAPHCRPIALGKHLAQHATLAIEYTKVSHVSLFPVRIYYVRKRH